MSRPRQTSSERLRSMRVRLANLLFFFAAGISFLFSVYLWFGGQKEEGLFVGLWVPSILSLGALMFASRGERKP
jgi:hypothetical protein